MPIQRVGPVNDFFARVVGRRMRIIGYTLLGTACFCGAVLIYGALLVSRDEKATARDRRNAGLD
jgi:hypothetical protein